MLIQKKNLRKKCYDAEFSLKIRNKCSKIPSISKRENAISLRDLTKNESIFLMSGEGQTPFC